MSDIQFEEDINLKKPLYPDQNSKGMIGFLVKRGYAKNVNVANIILIFVAIFFFTMSIIVFLTFS